MQPSRRQRYFRSNSPLQSIPVTSSGASGARNVMNAANLNVLEQGELVMDAGDPGDDHQQVAHEEIVDDVDNSEIPMEHHHHHHQMHHQIRHHHQNPYDDRQPQAYQVQSQPTQTIRRTVGRAMGQQPQRGGPSYSQNPMDMVSKLQSKAIYMPTQRPHTRISPTGARIVSFAGRKRENPDQLPPGVKKMQQHPQQRASVSGQQQKGLQPVKVVRLAPGSHRTNPSAAEQAIIEIEANIKQTVEDSKIDMQRIKDLQDAEFSQEDYHQMMGVLLMELERVNQANTSLSQYYRDRQRHEKTIVEAREDAFQARIRQLETENRKLRDGVFMLHMGKFGDASEGQNSYRQEHMGEMMVEEQEDQVVIEGHVENAEAEGGPEWIVEETVGDQMQGFEQEDHLEQPQIEEQHEVKTKNNLLGGGDGNDQFRGGNGTGSGGN